MIEWLADPVVPRFMFYVMLICILALHHVASVAERRLAERADRVLKGAFIMLEHYSLRDENNPDRPLLAVHLQPEPIRNAVRIMLGDQD